MDLEPEQAQKDLCLGTACTGSCTCSSYGSAGEETRVFKVGFALLLRPLLVLLCT